MCTRVFGLDVLGPGSLVWLSPAGACLHDGPAPTVSSARVWRSLGVLRVEHVEGPPCTSPFADVTALLR